MKMRVLRECCRMCKKTRSPSIITAACETPLVQRSLQCSHKPPFRSSLLHSPPSELLCYCWKAVASTRLPPPILIAPTPPSASSAAITELGRYYQRAGPRAGMSSEVALAIRAHLDIAENALADSAAANGGDFASGQEGADEALMRGLFTGM